MMRKIRWAGGLAALALIVAGCGETTAPEDTAATTTETTTEPGTPETTPAVETVSLSSEELAEIAKLPESDRPLAQAQKVCPISGEHLGSMGEPIKKSAGETPVFLCCKGCEADFDADPAAALAKLEGKTPESPTEPAEPPAQP